MTRQRWVRLGVLIVLGAMIGLMELWTAGFSARRVGAACAAGAAYFALMDIALGYAGTRRAVVLICGAITGMISGTTWWIIDRSSSLVWAIAVGALFGFLLVRSEVPVAGPSSGGLTPRQIRRRAPRDDPKTGFRGTPGRDASGDLGGTDGDT